MNETEENKFLDDETKLNGTEEEGEDTSDSKMQIIMNNLQVNI
jgi:hypothetical protein